MGGERLFIIWKSFTFKLILKLILFFKPKGFESSNHERFKDHKEILGLVGEVLFIIQKNLRLKC
jgi:hypothetical protein